VFAQFGFALQSLHLALLCSRFIWLCFAVAQFGFDLQLLHFGFALQSLHLALLCSRSFGFALRSPILPNRDRKGAAFSR
jgi:hypothetical protein